MMDPTLGLTGLALLALVLGVELTLLVRSSSRHTLARAWRLIHAGHIEQGRLLLQPLLDSSLPQRCEPARIALLAAARLAGDLAEVQRLLGRSERAALSPQNQRILAEEEVRARLALGQPARAVAAAESLRLLPGTPDEQLRAQELLAHALLWDGRLTLARATLQHLLEQYRHPQQAPRRAWVLCQLGQLCRVERRDAEAEHHLREASALAGESLVGRYARAALSTAAQPNRL